MLYFCKLVNNGLVHNTFLFEGKSVEDVKLTLNTLKQWPKGEWVIMPTDNTTEDDEV